MFLGWVGNDLRVLSLSVGYLSNKSLPLMAILLM
jgi:hypothetical protein